MQLARRVEDGHRVRVIEWDANSSTDLSAVVALFVVTVICAGAIVCASQTTSWARDLFVVLAVVSGLVWIMMAGTFLVIAVIVGAVRAHRITAPVDALMAIAAACLGGAAGLGT